MAPPASSSLVALAALATARAADPLGCLRWQGLGCDAITDQDACLGSRDGRPWRQWEGYRLSGEPCAWCGGKPCVKGSDALCAPRDWAEKDAPGVAVANCSAGFVVFPEGGVVTDGSAAEGDDAAGEFEEGAGGEGFRCTTEYAQESKEFNDLYFTFTAPTLEACKAICVGEDYCAGVEFVADGLACRVWWHAISTFEPADGHSCARRAPRAGTDLTPISSSEARARAAAKEAAAAEEARQREEEANATAISGGIAGGVAGAGLLAGLLGGLLGHTEGSGVNTADNRTLADDATLAAAEGNLSASHWVPFVVLALLGCVALLLLWVHTRSRAVSRSVTLGLDSDEESQSERAEAGIARGLVKQPFLRWPKWSSNLPPNEGVFVSDERCSDSPLARYAAARRGGADETRESRMSLMAPVEPLAPA